MRVLLTRPREQSLRLARRLQALGHETLISPVIAIAATGIPPKRGAATALAATSANAFRHLSAKVVAMLAALPVFAVGESTAGAAVAHGFAPPVIVAADVQGLVAALARRGLPKENFLYLAGKDRKPGLEAALREAGHAVVTTIVYEARAASALEPAVLAALRDGHIDVALHFSRRSADIFARLTAAADVSGAAAALRHVCISADAAQGLAGLEASDVRIAATPDSAAMLAALAG